MRLISFSPPILVASFVLLGADTVHFFIHGSWQGLTLAEALALLGIDFPASGFWLNLSPGWPLMVLGLIVGEAGLVQNRVLAAKEQKMMAQLRRQEDERRAKERHDDMMVRRQRRMNRIINRAA